MIVNKYDLFWNCTFLLGLVIFLWGLSLLLVAYGWFHVGVDMKDSWEVSNCTIANRTIEYSYNTYGPIERLILDVYYYSNNGELKEDKAGKKKKSHSLKIFTRYFHIIFIAALTSYRNAWVGHSALEEQMSKFKISASFTCYCPPDPNKFFELDKAQLGNFIIVDFNEDVKKSLHKYNFFAYKSKIQKKRSWTISYVLSKSLFGLVWPSCFYLLSSSSLRFSYIEKRAV